jgi:hypothetical protein
MTTSTREVLNRAIEQAEQKPASICSWCHPGAGDAKTSHTICTRHAEQMVAEIMADREKRAQIEAAAKSSTAACGKCNSCKSNSRFGCIHTARTNDHFAVTGY